MVLTHAFPFIPRLSLRAAGAALAAELRQWRRRSRERAELMRLNDRELRDFGVSRSDALAEWRKPLWRG